MGWRFNQKEAEAVVLGGLKRRTEVRIMTSKIRYSKQVKYLQQGVILEDKLNFEQ